ncbi:hypothetical protein WJX81_006664 [Elliptochloris bilobata]|uniref:CCT domain-containing protein n=1 Tax=Elliptochloris bilobata TaxID=381761 RepID=A0AAW1QI70_9CHLO
MDATWGLGSLDDLMLGGGSLDQAGLTDEEKLLNWDGASFPDALEGAFDTPSPPDDDGPNDRQVVLAARAAAGLNRGGIRRTAFSLGDLRALEVAGPPSPPDTPLTVHRSASGCAGASRAPRLASVPEGSVGAGPAPLLGGLGSGGAGGALGAVPMEELQAELRRRHAYNSALMAPGGHELQAVPSHLLAAHAGGTSAGAELAAIEDAPAMFYLDATQGGAAEPLVGVKEESAMPAAPGAELPLQDVHVLQQYADALLQGVPAEEPGKAAARSSAAMPAPALERSRPMRRSQSAVELRSTNSLARHSSASDLAHLEQVTVELTTPEGHTYRVGRLSTEERAQKILRYRQKRHERNFSKRIKYMCRKTLADSRPRVRGRFARNDDAGAVMPHETKKAQAAARRSAATQAAKGAGRGGGRGSTAAVAKADAVMKNIFGNLAWPHATVQLEFKREGGAPVKTASVKAKGSETETLPLFTNKDAVSGEVKVANVPGKKVEHQGIKVQLLGQIELASERGHPHDFVSLVRDLAPAGDLTSPQTYPFEFDNVEMQYDSYRGLQVRLRYLLRVTVTRGYGASVVKDFPFWVRNYGTPPQTSNLPPIKMEVGIEDCLHIEFEYDKSKYHLKDTVVGKIYFLLVRIKLKHMEIEIRRRETTGAGASARNESETLAKYEIMDGAPVRGENIPIRLFLAPYDLTPTYKTVHNKFSVKYYLNLVLVDEEDRRYFKQQEISLFRMRDPPPGPPTPAGVPHAVAPAPARLGTPPASP